MKKIILSMAILAVLGCKKEGCIDTLATNYDVEAGKDDGTCVFESKLIFFWTSGTGDNLYDEYGDTRIECFVNDKYIRDRPVNYSWGGDSPKCSSDGLFKTTIDLGTNKSTEVSYKFITEGGDLVWEGTATVTAEICEVIRLKL